MAIKHRGVKIVPVKTTRYEVRTVDNRKLMTFSSTSQAKAWINGYMKAFEALTPKAAPVTEPVEQPKPRRRRRVNGQPGFPNGPPPARGSSGDDGPATSGG